jgi:hypothetical protein
MLEHPTLTDDYIDKVRASIAYCGRYVMIVAESESGPSFAYTIGNASKGLPELLIEDDDLGAASAVLHAISDKMVERGRAFNDFGAVEIDVGGVVTVGIYDAGDGVKDVCALQVAHVLEINPASYRVQQVMLADKDGRLPYGDYQRGYSDGYEDGQREAHDFYAGKYPC